MANTMDTHPAITLKALALGDVIHAGMTWATATHAQDIQDAFKRIDNSVKASDDPIACKIKAIQSRLALPANTSSPGHEEQIWLLRVQQYANAQDNGHDANAVEAELRETLDRFIKLFLASLAKFIYKHDLEHDPDWQQLCHIWRVECVPHQGIDLVGEMAFWTSKIAGEE